MDKTIFTGCFQIERQVIHTNLVYGYLKINEQFQSQVDYEKYDTVFLTIKVKDLNQEINEDSATGKWFKDLFSDKVFEERLWKWKNKLLIILIQN